MKSLNISVDAKQVEQAEQGRAIARGMEEIQTQKELNKAREAKRTSSMLKNAAERVMFK